MKGCQNCAHAHENNGRKECHHQKAPRRILPIDYWTGETRLEFSSIADIRSDEDRCGMDARWWEQWKYGIRI